MWSASGPCVAPWGFACRGGRSADGGGSDLMSLHGHPRLPGPRVPIWPGQRRMVLEVLRGAGDGASGTATTTVPRASTPWGSCPPGSECQGRPICVILCQIAGLCSAGKAKGNPEASLPNHYTKPSTIPRSPTPPSHPACLPSRLIHGVRYELARSLCVCCSGYDGVGGRGGAEMVEGRQMVLDAHGGGNVSVGVG